MEVLVLHLPVKLFTKDYDLPNDTNYSETCAALGMIFFTFKMLQNFEQSCYADTI